MDNCKLCKAICEIECDERLCNLSYFFSHEDSQSMRILRILLSNIDPHTLRDQISKGSRVDGYEQIARRLNMECSNVKPEAQEGYVGDASGDRHVCRLCNYCGEDCDNIHCVLSHYFNNNNRLDLILISRYVGGIESVKEKLRVCTFVEVYLWIHQLLKIVEDKKIAAEVDVRRWTKRDLLYCTPTLKFTKLAILSSDHSSSYTFISSDKLSSRPFFSLEEDIDYEQHFYFEFDTFHTCQFSHVVWCEGRKVSSETCDLHSFSGSVIKAICFDAGFYSARFQIFDCEETMLLSLEYSFEVFAKEVEESDGKVF